jgi:hypothetical protein
MHAKLRLASNDKTPEWMASYNIYKGPFVTRYLALGNLWRRPSLSLYGMASQIEAWNDGATLPTRRQCTIRSAVFRSPQHAN